MNDKELIDFLCLAAQTSGKAQRSITDFVNLNRAVKMIPESRFYSEIQNETLYIIKKG